jgi:hypothetical protein
MTRDQERMIEQACEKVMCCYLTHVDRREFSEAVALFLSDCEWQSHGVRLRGREALLVALHASLDTGTIRHVMSNAVVTVEDEDNAVLHDYHTLYYSRATEFEIAGGPLPFEGPHRLTNSRVEFVRTSEGWRIALNDSLVVFRRDPEALVPLEIWAKGKGNLTS